MQLKSTLLCPQKHRNIPESAKWLGGEGAGSWFYIQHFSGNLFEIERWSPEGILECKGFFLLEDKYFFDLNAHYEIWYISHCAEVNILQGSNLLQFINVSNEPHS